MKLKFKRHKTALGLQKSQWRTVRHRHDEHVCEGYNASTISIQNILGALCVCVQHLCVLWPE